MRGKPEIGRGREPVVLVTGFDAFAGAAENPSALAAMALHGREIAGHRVLASILPTAFGESLRLLREALEQHRPSLVLACGQAGGRAAMSLERVAINLDDARIPDNRGARPIDRPVVPGGPAAYFASLPLKAMLQALRSAGLPAEVSQTAGTFVCNHVFYGLMHALAQEGDGVRGGFVHVPWLPTQGEPSMPLERIVQGLDIAIACALRTRQDIELAAGALD
ncbi:pyroglutamyl-peptidase I [Ramlibacter sp. AW1]|uniref:Pyrrolidone-carboxylate peptidase n=1 Tax=Ramlibacter aurantiacus TaxID=2801330 RepID=A0A937D9A1_9BURK|nr:pyroglutamyl-peptidase I [Ramlibacter aurantiacus]MBL0422931.1 pyroglutamyl-peptidase I [Ramlibacter aurantiacus]